MNGTITGSVSSNSGESAEWSRAKAWGKLLLRVLLLVLGAYLLWRLRAILTTIIVALVLAAAASALVEPLCRRRLSFLRPRTQRTLATIVVFIGLAAAVFVSFRLMLNPFQTEYANLQQNWTTYRTTLLDQITRAQTWYAALPLDVRNFVGRQLSQQSLPSGPGLVAGALGTTVSWATHIVELLLIPVLAFYFTLDARALRNEALIVVPRAHIRPALAILGEGGAIFRDYLVAQFWLAVIAGVATGLGLKLIGMQYALILGLFAGITRAIPVIGPLLGGIPVVLLSFVFGAQTGNPYLWVIVLVFFTILHLVESKFVMPRFLGHRLHLNAAVILIVLLIGGEFFGLMGMFLAAPVAALARVLIMHYVVLPRRRAEQMRRRSAQVITLGSGSSRLLRLERALHPSTAPILKD